MTFMREFVDAIQDVVGNNPACLSELFTDFRNLEGNYCHDLVVTSIKEAAKKLAGVTPSEFEEELGKNPRWRPDIRLLGPGGRLLGIVEYESLNSSDDRIISKDVYGYEGWRETLDKPVPLLIITTLPDALISNYRLLWIGRDRTQGYSQYNADHADKLPEIRRNPFRYWYAHYRRWLEHRINNLPVFFANFNGNELTLLDSWPGPAAPYEPKFEDGSDWSGLFVHTPDDIKQIRVTYKRKLWEQTDLARVKAVLAEYWEKEQAAWRTHGTTAWPEKFFRLWVKRMQNRDEACRWIEKVQWAKIY